MAWGKTQQAPKNERVVEFDSEGKTYRVRVAAEVFMPMYYAQQHINEVSLETDLISGDEILVVWSKVGVLRSVNAA